MLRRAPRRRLERRRSSGTLVDRPLRVGAWTRRRPTSVEPEQPHDLRKLGQVLVRGLEMVRQRFDVLRHRCRAPRAQVETISSGFLAQAVAQPIPHVIAEPGKIFEHRCASIALAMIPPARSARVDCKCPYRSLLIELRTWSGGTWRDSSRTRNRSSLKNLTAASSSTTRGCTVSRWIISADASTGWVSEHQGQRKSSAGRPSSRTGRPRSVREAICSRMCSQSSPKLSNAAVHRERALVRRSQ